jgi:hypothetical protein
MFTEPLHVDPTRLHAEIMFKFCMEHDRLDQMALAHDGLQRLKEELITHIAKVQSNLEVPAKGEDWRHLGLRSFILPEIFRDALIEASAEWRRGTFRNQQVLFARPFYFLQWARAGDRPPCAASLQNANNSNLFGSAKTLLQTSLGHHIGRNVKQRRTGQDDLGSAVVPKASPQAYHQWPSASADYSQFEWQKDARQQPWSDSEGAEAYSGWIEWAPRAWAEQYTGSDQASSSTGWKN